jgi:hypothetical protein
MRTLITLIAYIFATSVMFGQNCSDNIVTAFNGNQNNTIEVTVFDGGGVPLGTLNCPISNNGGQNYNVNCDLSAYGSDVFYSFNVCNGASTSCFDCAYDSEGNFLGFLSADVTETSIALEPNRNDLTWKTTSESSNAYFELEFSADAHQWSPLIKIPAAGESSETIEYRHSHQLNFAQKHKVLYYRLSRVDYEGNKTLIDILTANRKMEAVKVKSVQDQMKITLPAYHDYVQIKAIDLMGRSMAYDVITGQNTVSFTLPNQSVYVLHLEDQFGNVETIKVFH